MNIARYYNKDWKPNWEDSNETKFHIRYVSDLHIAPTYEVDWNQGIAHTGIIFKNKEDAIAVINNPDFKNILDDIYKN